MILGIENRIFPGKYENSQINLCGIIQYKERSIVIYLYLCPQTMVELWKEKI